MNEITSFKTLIGSLYKKLNRASSYGTLDLKTLLLIDIINEYIYDCPTCYNNSILNKLKNLLINLQNSDRDICVYREQQSLYTNIIGCRDCNPNNSNLTVVNTAPIITNPEPVEPVIIAPTLCNNTVTVPIIGNFNFNSINLNCYQDFNEGVLQNIRINSLPIRGSLTYNGMNVTINQVINIGDLSNLVYNSFANIKVGDDIITIQASGTTQSTLYSNIADINIIRV